MSGTLATRIRRLEAAEQEAVEADPAALVVVDREFVAQIAEVIESARLLPADSALGVPHLEPLTPPAEFAPYEQIAWLLAADRERAARQGIIHLEAQAGAEAEMKQAQSQPRRRYRKRQEKQRDADKQEPTPAAPAVPPPAALTTDELRQRYLQRIMADEAW